MIGRDIDLTEGLDFGKDPKSLPAMISNDDILRDCGKKKNPSANYNIISSNYSTSYITWNYNTIGEEITSLNSNDYDSATNNTTYSNTLRRTTFHIESNYGYNGLLDSDMSYNITYNYIDNDAYVTMYPDQRALECTNTTWISSPSVSINPNDPESLLNKDKEEYMNVYPIEAHLSEEKIYGRPFSSDRIIRLLEKDEEELNKRFIDNEMEYITEVELKGYDYRHPDLDHKIKSPWLRKMKSWNYKDYIKELEEEVVDYMEYLTSNWFRVRR